MASRDISQELADARREAARTDLSPDDPYLELMATHVALGELLEIGVVNPAGLDEYRRLVQQLIDVGRDVVEYEEQRFAVWLSRITVDGGEVEGGQ